MPIVSLQIQENNLFDYNNGIYTAGVDFDTWRAANPSNNQAWRANFNNYWRSGRDWEFPANVELFKPNTLEPLMNISGGVRIHGNNSRGEVIKNLRLYARSDYDEKSEFEHDLFQQKIPGAVYNDKFKRILLRGNNTNPNFYTHFINLSLVFKSDNPITDTVINSRLLYFNNYFKF